MIFSTASGARYNEKITAGIIGDNTRLWKWSAKVRCTSSGWNAEIVIPYHLFAFFNNPNKTLSFNICRTSTSAKEVSSWSPQKVSFHDPKGFGILLFDKKINRNELKIFYNTTFISFKKTELKEQWEKLKKCFSDKNEDEFYRAFAHSQQAKIKKVDMQINSKINSEMKLIKFENSLKEINKSIINYDVQLQKELTHKIFLLN